MDTQVRLRRRDDAREYRAGSQLQAYSAKGALFQLMLIYSQVDALWEERAGDDAFRHYDRIQRLCWSVRDFFYHALDVRPYDFDFGGGMRSGLGPHWITKLAIDQYREDWPKLTA